MFYLPQHFHFTFLSNSPHLPSDSKTLTSSILSLTLLLLGVTSICYSSLSLTLTSISLSLSPSPLLSQSLLTSAPPFHLHYLLLLSLSPPSFPLHPLCCNLSLHLTSFFPSTLSNHSFPPHLPPHYSITFLLSISSFMPPLSLTALLPSRLFQLWPLQERGAESWGRGRCCALPSAITRSISSTVRGTQDSSSMPVSVIAMSSSIL
ncbi:hypothetical protein EGW08_017686, partial [Elysia chlorotica]